MYKVVRFFHSSRRKLVVMTGLTLEEAQAHCNNPNTSSRTCTDKNGKERTKRYGMWFDGYTAQ